MRIYCFLIEARGEGAVWQEIIRIQADRVEGLGERPVRLYRAEEQIAEIGAYIGAWWVEEPESLPSAPFAF